MTQPRTQAPTRQAAASRLQAPHYEDVVRLETGAAILVRQIERTERLRDGSLPGGSERRRLDAKLSHLRVLARQVEQTWVVPAEVWQLDGDRAGDRSARREPRRS